MFKNYVKVAFRVFQKEKSVSLINISGLALAFTCCLIIFLFIKHELSYDDFHNDGERIYRVASAYMRAGKWEPYSSNSWRTGELLKERFAEIEYLVRIRRKEEIVVYQDKRINEGRMATVDDTFFKVFSFPLIQGDPDDALKGTNKVVISESIAVKYFGKEQPMGKMFEINDGEYHLEVSGIIQDMPANSHFHFDFLISGQTARQIAPPAMFTNIGWDSQYLYIKVRDKNAPASMESKFSDFINEHLDFLTDNNFKLFLQPLADIHLKSNNGLEIEQNGNIRHIYIFSIVAFFILVIACINYMNITTARSIRRANEVGMRKALGANKLQLIGQFLSESFFLTFLAILVAFGLTYLLLPYFNTFAGKELDRGFLFTPELLITLLVSLVLIGIFSGGYPAFVLSAFKPLNTLKGGHTFIGPGPALRKGLVVLQFGISIGLIAATCLVFQQLIFLKNKELGINKELLVSVPLETMDRSQLDVARNELLSISSINKVGASNMKMPGWISNSTYYKAQGVPIDEDARKSMKIIRVDFDFLDVVEAKIVLGREFLRSFPADSTSSILLNESAVNQLGWINPIGQWVEFDALKYNVVGVLSDFHFESLHRKIPPTIFILSASWLNWLYIRIDGNSIPTTLAHIKAVYSKFITTREFSYSFTDEDVEKQYRAEDKFTQIIAIFTFLAIVIACLGTFGLISFTAERKSKEIGIRKILGASIGDVSYLLIKEFIGLLLIASLIAWPITFYFINNWLKEFVYRTSIGIEAFLVATILALLITLVTTGFKAVQAGLANPLESLRDD